MSEVLQLWKFPCPRGRHGRSRHRHCRLSRRNVVVVVAVAAGAEAEAEAEAEAVVVRLRKLCHLGRIYLRRETQTLYVGTLCETGKKARNNQAKTPA